jgi:hypothetical protein
MQRRFLGKRRDNNKIAAMAMMIAGQATVSEVARLAGTSRQRVQHWAKYGIDYKGPPWPKKSEPAFDLDVKAARNALLAKQWAAELEKLEVEDYEATEQEWQALKALQAPAKPQRKTKAKAKAR